MNDLDVTFLDRLKLSGGGVQSDLSELSDPSGLETMQGLKSGDSAMVAARWQTIAPLDKNYSVSAVLLAPNGAVLTSRETYPGLGLRPTRYLQPGHSFTDIYPLTLETDVTEPLVARAVVSLFDVESTERTGFPALDAAGSEVTPVVGQVKVTPPPVAHLPAAKRNQCQLQQHHPTHRLRLEC